jgi:SAM-dependent methyltransferase
MDDPRADPRDLARSLRFIRMVNRRLGGTRAVLSQLERWSPGRPAQSELRILDVGTGSADIPVAIVEWARARGQRVRVTGIDANPATLELARQHVADRPEIELFCADALGLVERFGTAAFDYAHAGMFLHHLGDVQVLTALRIMDRLTTRGLIWNDLVRGPVEAIGVRLLALGQPAAVRHDAIASVAAAFTRREALDLARRVGLSNVRYRRHLFGRFTLVSSKKSDEATERRSDGGKRFPR